MRIDNVLYACNCSQNILIANYRLIFNNEKIFSYLADGPQTKKPDINLLLVELRLVRRLEKIFY